MKTNRLEEDLAPLHPASFGWALACCGFDRDEAEEVVQETYVTVLSGRASFDGRSSLKTWLFGVMRRIAAGRRRRRFLRGLAMGRWRDGLPPAPPTESPEAAARDAELRGTLSRALLALPGRQREMLHLVFYQDLTVEESAGVLGISVGSARTHYHRGKQQLRERLAAEERA